MDHASHTKIVSFIWSIADDCLRDVFVRGKYRDVILPMFVLRSIDCFLEESKQAVLDAKTAILDEQIAKKKQQIELLDEQKNILINRAVTRGLNPDVKLKPSGVDWIGEIPERWEVKRLGYIGRVGNGSTPSRSNTLFWDSPDFPWLNSSSVNQDVVTDCDQYVSTAALGECHLPKLGPGTAIIAITGQGKTRGTAALMKVHATINQHLAYLAVQDSEVLPEYVHLSQKAQYNQLRSISESGSTKGALTCQDIKEFKIVVPPQDIQTQIIQKRHEIKEIIHSHPIDGILHG